MNIEDYLELYSSHIKTLIETNPTDFTEESFKEAVISTIQILEPYRLDDCKTRQTVVGILRKYQRGVRTPDGEIDHYDEHSIDSVLLSHILLKYCKREVSFHYAYVLLQQSVNGRVAFAEDLLFRSEQEIEEAVLLDMTERKQKEAMKGRFEDLLVCENKEELMNKLHELLDYKKGKDVATVIKAMEKLHLLKPYSSVSNLHALITAEFGDIGGKRNFSNYMQGLVGYQLKDSDIEQYESILV